MADVPGDRFAGRLTLDAEHERARQPYRIVAGLAGIPVAVGQVETITAEICVQTGRGCAIPDAPSASAAAALFCQIDDSDAPPIPLPTDAAPPRYTVPASATPLTVTLTCPKDLQRAPDGLAELCTSATGAMRAAIIQQITWTVETLAGRSFSSMEDDFDAMEDVSMRENHDHVDIRMPVIPTWRRAAN